MPKKKKTVKETPKTISDFNEYADDWIHSEVELGHVLSVPGVIELVLEHYHNDILKDYEDYCDEQLTHEQFQAKYYYR